MKNYPIIWGSLINHYKDPCKPTRISWKVVRVFFVAQVLGALCQYQQYQNVKFLVFAKHFCNLFKQEACFKHIWKKSDWRPFPLPEITVASGKLLVGRWSFAFGNCFLVGAIFECTPQKQNNMLNPRMEVDSSDNFLGACKFNLFFLCSPRIIGKNMSEKFDLYFFRWIGFTTS